jgi:hypothetical protein
MIGCTGKGRQIIRLELDCLAFVWMAKNGPDLLILP